MNEPPTAEFHVIRLHLEAPQKPALGAACNGCGVCCAAELCPVARILFRKKESPCPALEWQENELRYRCGLLARPATYLPISSPLAQRWITKLVFRMIAAGKGCDSDCQIDPG